MDNCTGCHRGIDPRYEAMARDSLDQSWHTICMTRTRGPQPITHVQNAGPLWALAVVTVLLPIVGLVAGIVYLFRNRIGPGLALLAEAVVLTAAYVVLLSPAQAAVTRHHPHVPPPIRQAVLNTQAADAFGFLNFYPDGTVIDVRSRFTGCRVAPQRIACGWRFRVLVNHRASARITGVAIMRGGRVRVMAYHPETRRSLMGVR